MSEQENVQIVKEAYAAFMRGDIPAILNTLADSVVWFLPGPTDVIPVAGERRGREQVEEFFSILDETQEAQQFEPQEFIAQAEKVVVQGHYRWRIKSTGREAASDWVHVFTFRDGKVVEFREYYDTAAVAEAYRETSAQAAQTT
ncbi:MAG TPA: nuclear transport factor 2 family protein [Pyrinomonadaceae bacterium]